MPFCYNRPNRMKSAPTILYLYFNPQPRDRVQELTFAGIRRYAAACGWNAEAWPDARPETLAAFLAAHVPLAGCVVECSDDNGTLSPRLFGRVPVVYLHASPSLYGRRAARVVVDDDAVARTAFRELSTGRPAAYAVVGDIRGFRWSHLRERAFAALCAEAGAECRVFPHVSDREKRAARMVRWTAALPRRTAVFAANDFSASEVVAAALAAGRAIPQELTLCGVDNLAEVCETSSPTITSIQLDFEREGFVAAGVVGGGSAATTAPLLAVRRRSTAGSGRREPHVLAAVDLIRREACEGLTPSDVIRRAPGSKSLFNLRFREATGHSVHDEIEHVRMEKVFALLSQTDTAIGAIADMCGYRTNIALHKAFRLQTGMSMSAWRAQNRR